MAVVNDVDEAVLAERVATFQNRLSAQLAGIRIPELLVGFSLVLFGMSVPGVPFPATYVGLIALTALATLRRPTIGLASMSWLPVMLVGILGYTAFISFVHLGVEPTWVRRWIRIAIVIAALLSLIGGRVHLASVLKGLAVGLAANFVAFYAGLAPDNYQGVLSGWFRDKNQAGLAYCVYGLLLLQLVKSSRWRFVLFVVIGGAVWLTGSRTALAGWLVAGIWLAFSHRWTAITRYLLPLAILALVDLLERQFARFGRFATREGSDQFRARIEVATNAKLAASSPWGEGLGGAHVIMDDQRWFFHSSYKTLLYEGGWPLAIGVVTLTVLVVFRPLQGRRLDPGARAVEAACIALLVCAWKLGEVFLTPVWMLLIASAAWYHLLDQQRARGLDFLPLPKIQTRALEHAATLSRLHRSATDQAPEQPLDSRPHLKDATP